MTSLFSDAIREHMIYLLDARERMAAMRHDRRVCLHTLARYMAVVGVREFSCGGVFVKTNGRRIYFDANAAAEAAGHSLRSRRRRQCRAAALTKVDPAIQRGVACLKTVYEQAPRIMEHIANSRNIIASYILRERLSGLEHGDLVAEADPSGRHVVFWYKRPLPKTLRETFVCEE